MKSLKFFASFVSISLFAAIAPGCASDAAEDEADTTEETQDELTTGSNYGYYIVTAHDSRRCVSPVCGGLFVKRVNAAQTRCADGTMQASCYVANIDTSALGLSDDENVAFQEALASGQALVRAARMSAFTFNGIRLGRLTANEGWLAQGPAGPAPRMENALPAGTFYRAKDNGVRCKRAPCPTTTVAKLNSTRTLTTSGVNLAPANATRPQNDAAMDAYHTQEGFLLAGAITGKLSTGQLATANQFYLRAVTKIGKACGGLMGATCPANQTCIWANGDICGAADAMGHCQTLPTYCPKNLMPVCGCNGKTYGNECLANAAGTSVASNGACANP